MKKIVLVIIIVLLSFLIFINLVSQKNSYSRDEIISLLEKGSNTNNYSCEYVKANNNDVTIKRKGDKYSIDDKSGIILYYSDSFKKQTIVNQQKKIAIITESETPIVTIYMQKYTSLAKKENMNFTYLKNERIRGFNCAKWKSENEHGSYEVWVDVDTGLVIKDSCIVYKLEEANSTTEYNVKFNCVSDNEVEIPDLKGYDVKEFNR